MPALPNVPNVLRYDLVHTFANDTDVISRFFVQYSGTAPSATALASFATTNAGNWNTVWAPLAHPEITLTAIHITDLTSPTAAQGSWAGSHSGTRSGGALTAASCALMNFSISRRYRGGKPRIYLPYGTVTDLASASLWGTAFQTSMDSAWSTWITDVGNAYSGGTGLVGQVNISYYEGFASVENPVTHRWRNISTPRTTALIDAITATNLNLKPGSQRRRNLH